MKESAGRGKFASHAIGDDDASDRLGLGDDRGAGGGNSATFDTMDVTTYLHSDNKADGSFTEHFILQVNGFELNGSPENLPGFGSAFGMYFLIDATGQTANGATTFNSMNIALMVDRGNNDGAPSSTEFGGTTFANGTHGDYRWPPGPWSPPASMWTLPPGPGTRTSSSGSRQPRPARRYSAIRSIRAACCRSC